MNAIGMNTTTFVKVAASTATATSEVPISAAETPFSSFFFQSDPETGVILYLGGTLGFEDVNSGMYDFFLPGGGVLAWHVNEDRIEAGLIDNTINRYGDGLLPMDASPHFSHATTCERRLEFEGAQWDAKLIHLADISHSNLARFHHRDVRA